NSIETAITAFERDEASGMSVDDAMLVELRASREKLITDRAVLEARWQKELAAAKRVNELRGGLAVFKGNGRDKGTEGQRDKGTDETALRGQIGDALTALRAAQAGDSLVHPHVDAAAVASVVADWTGIPVGKMVRDEIAAILKMEERLRT